MKNLSQNTKFKKTSPKGKDLSLFVRFGGLDLKNQNGFGKNTFHSPPSSRGFYAFPKSMQEHFLIGSLDKTQKSIFAKMPEYPENGTKEEKEEYQNYDWDKFNEERDKRYTEIRKEFRKSTGYIWHHLGEYCKPFEVEEIHNSWVKTTISVWKKAFSKSTLNDRYGEDWRGKGRGDRSINSARGLAGWYSKDHYEVFFDEKV